MLNSLDKQTEDAVRRFVRLISSRYAIAEVIVYGSRARGAHRPDPQA